MPTPRLLTLMRVGADDSEADFATVTERFVAAAQAMYRDGWWWSSQPLTNKSIRRRILKELLQARWRTTSSMRTSSIGSISWPPSKYSGDR